MTYLGVVKEGKIELPADALLPDGTAVRVEVVDDAWLAHWDKLTEQMTAEYQGSESLLDSLLESRR